VAHRPASEIVVTRKKELNFAEARARLLEILHEVESDSGDVDQLASRLKEAAELHRFCNERLAAARAQVAAVVADLAAAEQGLARDADSSDGEHADSDGDEDADEDDEGSDSDASDGEAGGTGGRKGGRPGRLPF